MRVRDAVETDAAALASMTGRPQRVVRDMIHDRSVRVAVTGESADGSDEDAEEGGDDEASSESVAGFVAFDARDATVHVTNFEGEPDAVGRLFEEPIGFAEREGLAVEAVVPSDGRATGVIESLGFEALGSGPRIEGAPTTRYRFEPGEN